MPSEELSSGKRESQDNQMGEVEFSVDHQPIFGKIGAHAALAGNRKFEISELASGVPKSSMSV
jgi:hypothetical protein